MKKLFLLLALLPLFAKSQVTGTIQKTPATGIVRGNFGVNGLDSALITNGVGVDGYVPVYKSALKKSVFVNPSTFGTTFTVGTISNGGNANGMSLVGTSLRLFKVNATNGGVLTTGTDTIAGVKKFQGQVSITETTNQALNVSTSSATAITGQASSSGTGGAFSSTSGIGVGISGGGTALNISGNFTNGGIVAANSGGNIFQGNGTSRRVIINSSGNMLLTNLSAGTVGTDSLLVKNSSNVVGKISGNSYIQNQTASAQTSSNYFISGTGTYGTNPSTTGTLRLPNANLIGWRNAANSADFTFGLNASNQFDFNRGLNIDGANSLIRTGNSLRFNNASNDASFGFFNSGGSGVSAATIDASILPSTGGTYDLGTSSLTFNHGYLNGATIASPTASLSATFSSNNANGVNVRFRKSAVDQIYIGNSEAISGLTNAVEFYGVSGKGINLVTNGNATAALMLSTASALRLPAYGAGALTTDASGNVTAASDEKLKNITGKFTRGLEAIHGISPINYYWKDKTGLDTKNEYSGFGAQNIQKNIPEAVGQMENGDLTLQDRPILATLVNAVNELSAQVDILKSQANGATKKALRMQKQNKR